MSEIQAVIETGAYVDDLDKAEQFYHEVLGLPVAAKEAGRAVFFQVGAASMLLVFNADATLQPDQLPAQRRAWSRALCPRYPCRLTR